MEEKPKLTQRTKGFFKEVQAEMKKVTWPTKGELYGSTTVVVAVTVLLSIFLFVLDSGLGHVMSVLFTI